MADVEVEVTRERIGAVSPNLFGGLLEHLGRCVYDGVWDLRTQSARVAAPAAVTGS